MYPGLRKGGRDTTPILASLIKMVPFSYFPVYVSLNAKIEEKLSKLCFTSDKIMFISIVKPKIANI